MKSLLNNLNDVQGLLIYGYGYLRYADYLILHFEGSPTESQQFMAGILPDVVDAQVNPRQACYALALGKTGLEKLGVEVSEHGGFSRAFIEGMNTPHRNRILGDHGGNKPENWLWGGEQHLSVDLLLISFARSNEELQARRNSLEQKMAQHGVRTAHSVVDTYLDTKEHFGFRDGISQPVIKGSGRPVGQNDELPAGEFIFGYPNEYDKLPQAPAQIGKNGSYLVFRQLEQDVMKFWNYFLTEAKNQNQEEAVYLAAKMVGRWPEGKPLVPISDLSANEDMNARNWFGYYQEDAKGFGCPHGAHIRRTNPRDALEDNPKQSLDASNKHRLLRRGRAYGLPLSSTFNVEEMMHTEDDGESRGLNFLCFNTDIERQFEFVQHTWCNNDKFNRRYEEIDPISGVGHPKRQNSNFKIPEKPFRRRLTNLPQFVTLRGGAYFFFPSIAAIKKLST